MYIYTMLLNNGVTLYRIREPKCPILNDKNSINLIRESKNTNKSLNDVINILLKKIFNIDFYPNIDEDYNNILNLQTNIEIKDSLSIWCKENDKEFLLDEWDYEKNGDLLPSYFSYGSNKKVFWKCPNDKIMKHSYDCKICHRTLDGINCSYCSNHKVLKGFNDLATLYPKVVALWDYEKNKDYIPSNWNIKRGEFTPENIINKGKHYKAYFIGYEEPQRIITMVNRLYPKS